MAWIMFLNTWGGNVPGYFTYIQNMAMHVDIFCLSEVHNHYGTESLHAFPSPTNRVGAVELKQFRLLQDLLADTHQGYYAESYRGLHDCQPGQQSPIGLAMFIRRSIPAHSVSSMLINREYGQLFNGTSSASRVIQSAFVILGEKQHLLAHTHGLWTPKGKIDTDERDLQSTNIIEHLNRRFEEPFSSKPDQNIILGGDFNYTRSLRAYKALAAGKIFGQDGADVLTDGTPQWYETRTAYYKKPLKEANFIFVSSGLPYTLTIDRTAPSDHAALILKVTA